MRLTSLAVPALLALSTAAVAAPLHPQPLRSDTPIAFQRAADTVIVQPQTQAAVPPANTVIVAPQAPPTIRTEVIPPAPSTEVVWHPGHWASSGTQYIWVPGEYVARPRPQVAWVPGHWDQASNGWLWVDGHWQ